MASSLWPRDSPPHPAHPIEQSESCQCGNKGPSGQQPTLPSSAPPLVGIPFSQEGKVCLHNVPGAHAGAGATVTASCGDGLFLWRQLARTSSLALSRAPLPGHVGGSSFRAGKRSSRSGPGGCKLPNAVGRLLPSGGRVWVTVCHVMDTTMCEARDVPLDVSPPQMLPAHAPRCSPRYGLSYVGNRGTRGHRNLCAKQPEG